MTGAPIARHNLIVEIVMKTVAAVAVVVAVLSGPLAAQESKPVPNDSVRVVVPGCTKGLMFTAGPRTEDQPNRSAIPPGMHLRMSGPKKIMAEIKAHESSMIEITGLIKKGQYGPDGVGIGNGVRLTPGPPSAGGGVIGNPNVNQTIIDVEGWRPVVGSCPR
jgi:hypothetical protein